MSWQLLQSTLYQMYWFSIFLDFTSKTERKILMLERHSFFIDLPKLAPLRGHFSCIAMQEETREMAVTGYKSLLNWRRAKRQGSFLAVGEVFQLHWTATARLKLSSSQPVRCCPATGHLPYWVRRP